MKTVKVKPYGITKLIYRNKLKFFTEFEDKCIVKLEEHRAEGNSFKEAIDNLVHDLRKNGLTFTFKSKKVHVRTNNVINDIRS